MNNVVLIENFLSKRDSLSEELSSSGKENTDKENAEHADALSKVGSDNQHLADIQSMSRTKLRNIYKGEYSSWRNMKTRVQKGAFIHPDFDDFCSFLACLGPKPASDYTLDRIDNKNREYGPGLVRWADKRTQNNNRSNTLYLTDKNGTKKPLTEWAKIKGAKPDTLRQRLRKGWEEHEVIHGREPIRDRILNITPWPNGERDDWERLYQQHCAERALGPVMGRIEFLINTNQSRLIYAMNKLTSLEKIAVYRDLSKTERKQYEKLSNEIIEWQDNIDHAFRERLKASKRKKRIERLANEFSPKIEAELRRRYGPID